MSVEAPLRLYIFDADGTLRKIRRIAIATAIGFVFGALANRSAGIYFLMITLTFSVIATYTLGQVTKISGFSTLWALTASFTPATKASRLPGFTERPAALRWPPHSPIRCLTE